MKPTQKNRERIIDELKMKGAPGNCPICKKNSWTIAESFYFLSNQENLPDISMGGAGMPLAAIACNNCGNTHFINLLSLGFGDEFSKQKG